MIPTIPPGYRPSTPETPRNPITSHFDVKWAPGWVRVEYNQLKLALMHQREAYQAACLENDDVKKALYLEKFKVIESKMTDIETVYEKNGYRID